MIRHTQVPVPPAVPSPARPRGAPAPPPDAAPDGTPERAPDRVLDGPARTCPPPVRDLRATGEPPALCLAPGDRVVVSGLPGSGKSTLIQVLTARLGDAALPIDSQDVREHWERRLPGRLPYALYRPAVRVEHYLRLRRALRTGTSVVVHDCGNLPWVRRWLARDARRRGLRLHLVLLDVAPGVALAGQAERGRTVSRAAFARHRRAVERLLAELEAGRLPAGCDAAVLLDRAAVDGLRRRTDD
ncbi:AAA family ATPase [Streptomyces sp. TRM 70351]|uniref:AAA family ATPase n=1 Tax=Streptomyces sp. TRM 70351 TaxID=3116552 RepID=UPI002E7C2E80|nr:AAA family ATPase [Streptomyces sp. TRM 70351]MEE1927383.1 AAA family ATPase [Streptomyces sp. TRM 70351]